MEGMTVGMGCGVTRQQLISIITVDWVTQEAMHVQIEMAAESCSGHDQQSTTNPVQIRGLWLLFCFLRIPSDEYWM